MPFPSAQAAHQIAGPKTPGFNLKLTNVLAPTSAGQRMPFRTLPDGPDIKAVTTFASAT